MSLRNRKEPQHAIDNPLEGKGEKRDSKEHVFERKTLLSSSSEPASVADSSVSSDAKPSKGLSLSKAAKALREQQAQERKPIEVDPTDSKLLSSH